MILRLGYVCEGPLGNISECIYLWALRWRKLLGIQTLLYMYWQLVLISAVGGN